jgi:hypothetical protein
MDVDDALRMDADRWRAAQKLELELDLDSTLETVLAAPHRSRRRGLAVVAAAAAVVVASGGVALVANRVDTRAPRPAATKVSAPTTHSTTPPTPVVSSSSAPARLPTLGPPPPGQQTLLRSSGHDNQTWNIKRATGRGEIYVACLGGGMIKFEMPGHGGFDVDCTGIATGASLPSLGRTVRIRQVTGQHWQIAVFGR